MLPPDRDALHVSFSLSLSLFSLAYLFSPSLFPLLFFSFLSRCLASLRVSEPSISLFSLAWAFNHASSASAPLPRIVAAAPTAPPCPPVWFLPNSDGRPSYQSLSSPLVRRSVAALEAHPFSRLKRRRPFSRLSRRRQASREGSRRRQAVSAGRMINCLIPPPGSTDTSHLLPL